MVRSFPSENLQPEGVLEFEEVISGIIMAYFTPPLEALRSKTTNPDRYKRKILEINQNDHLVTIIPYQVWSLQPMSNRYINLSSISFDLEWYNEPYTPDLADMSEFLSAILPDIFITNYNFGFGFLKKYRPIASLFDRFGIKALYITNKDFTNIDPGKEKATIKLSDLRKMKSSIDNITQRAQRVSASLKREAIGDLFTRLLTNHDAEYASQTITAKLIKHVSGSSRLLPGGASKTEQKDAIDVIRKNAQKILNEQPRELFKLRNDIELVSLEELINKFEGMINKSLPESYWQKLFDENPFILHMAFGIPVLKVQGQASVGGRKFTGSGEKITDFLLKNSITNNAAIVEIKTPATKLLNPKEYRNGVFAPSSDLTGAINQVLDQIFQFQRQIDGLKASSREYELESYFVIGILIIGSSLKGLDEQKSFELFRSNSKNIQIITFIELLEKLKNLHSFLLAELPKEVPKENEDDLPF